MFEANRSGRHNFDEARTGNDNIELAFLRGDLRVETVDIGRRGDVSPDGCNTSADFGHGLVEFGRSATDDEDICAFIDESLGYGESDSAAASRDDGDFTS